MASTSAIFQLKAQFLSVTQKTVRTPAYFVVAPKFLAGNAFYNGNTPNSTIRAWLPSARVPIGYGPKGEAFLFSPEWYRFFEEVANRRLGGINGPTVPSIQSQVVTTQEAVIVNEQQIVNTQAVIVQNAQSLLASREVSIGASLPGAALIPTPVTEIE